jgi:hypothetical protein
LLAVDAKNVDKRLPASAVTGAIRHRLRVNGAVHLKFRRHVEHSGYTGEYRVAVHAMPKLGAIGPRNTVMGPLVAGGPAHYEGVRRGDRILAINGESMAAFDLSAASAFASLCKAALLRDGSLVLQLEHAEHNVEASHNALHPHVHTAAKMFFGGGLFSKLFGKKGKSGGATKHKSMRRHRSMADAAQ